MLQLFIVGCGKIYNSLKTQLVMKRLFLFFMAVGFAAAAYGQANEPFCCVTPGAELKYVTTDAKGKNETGRSVTKINSVSGLNGNYTISQTVTTYVNGTQLMAPMEITTTITDGNASVALGGGIAVEVNSNIPVIPANLEVGMELQCGDIVMNVAGIKTTQSIESHKVVTREELTTDAGTFDCFVVEQVYTAQVAFVKVKGSQKVWYARGVGNVKTETYNKKGKLASRQTLISFTK